MCYIAESACNKELKSKELTAEEWVRIAKDGVKNGLVFLTLTGGEIFLRPDFFEIYEPIRELGIIVTLFTNGNLVTNTVAKRLAVNPPNKVEITLYGATEKTYELVTGSRKGYQLCLNGIDNLLSYEINPVIKTTITRQNIHELEDMRQMAADRGLPFLSSYLLTKRVDGAVSRVDDARLSSEEAVKLEKEDRASALEWSEKAVRLSGNNGEGSVEDIFYCSAGKSAFLINSYGEMNACADLPLPAARVLDVGFKSAWEAVQDYVDSHTKKTSTCSTCNLNSLCNTCPAYSYQESKKLNEPVPYLCEITFERSKQFNAG